MRLSKKPNASHHSKLYTPNYSTHFLTLSYTSRFIFYFIGNHWVTVSPCGIFFLKKIFYVLEIHLFNENYYVLSFWICGYPNRLNLPPPTSSHLSSESWGLESSASAWMFQLKGPHIQWKQGMNHHQRCEFAKYILNQMIHYFARDELSNAVFQKFALVLSPTYFHVTHLPLRSLHLSCQQPF